jgi:DNA-binding MarR family transcriptional regulator
VGEDPGVAAFGAFLRAHAAVVRRLEDELEAERAMPLAWYEVLLHLERAPDRHMRMQELGDAVVLSRSRVSRIVDDMERAGFVAREACPTDRRVVHAALTPKGRGALRRAAPVHLRGIEAHFTALLSADELATLQQACERLSASGTMRPAGAQSVGDRTKLAR